MDWTLRSLEEADSIMYRWFAKADDVSALIVPKTSYTKLRFSPSLRDALFDDLNTPLAITELHRIDDAMAVAHGSGNDAEFEKQAEFFLTGLALLGLYDLSEDVRAHRQRQRDIERRVIEERIAPLIEARLAARKAKDFKESDRIRDELAAQGIILKDGPQGTTWEVKK
jgi:cysteinyl-tRNA synthetase